MGSKPCAGYFRVSKARDDMHSPDIYTDEIERYCSYRSLDLRHIFQDIDFSGYKNSRKRPGLASLVEQRQDFSAVVIPKLSRFGRSLAHLTELFELFDNEGIALIFLDVGLDTSSSQGRLLRNIMAAFAEFESDVKSDYSRANFRHVAEQGLVWGPPPYGYHRQRNNDGSKTWRVEPGRAEVVKDIFHKYLSGWGTEAIQRDLNGRGIPTARGKRWSYGGVRWVLLRPAYAGLIRLEDELVPASWQPIVTLQEWEAAQKIFESKRRPTRHWQHPRPPRLLSGLIFCGDCGQQLRFHFTRWHPDGIYRCSLAKKQRRCPAGGILAHRADALVAKAYLERHGASLVRNPSSDNAVVDISSIWERLTVDEKRNLVAVAIERVEMLPRDPSNPFNKGLPRGRQLRVSWRKETIVPSLSSPIIETTVTPLPSVGKVCSGCGRRMPLKYFRKSSRSQDGREAVCSYCRGGSLPKPRSLKKDRLTPQKMVLPSSSWGEWRKERMQWWRSEAKASHSQGSRR